MDDFFDRLDKYMSFSGLNDNKLTVKAGLSIGSLGKQRKGSRGLSSDSIAKILYYCTDLNADWLLTGRGDMIYTSSSSPPELYNPQAQDYIELQKKHIEILEDKVKSLESQINTLKTAAAHLVPARPNPSEPLPAAVIKQPAGKPNKRESQ